MNSKLTLPGVLLLIGTVLYVPVQAENGAEPASQASKNILNLKIDKRLGLLEQPWKVPDFLALKKNKFPNRFGHRQARFLQPGPPPYYQQPEGANEAGRAILVPTTTSTVTPTTTTLSPVAAPVPPPPIPGTAP